MTTAAPAGIESSESFGFGSFTAIASPAGIESGGAVGSSGAPTVTVVLLPMTTTVSPVLEPTTTVAPTLAMGKPVGWN